MRPRARGTFHSHVTLSLVGAGISAIFTLATLPLIVRELGLAAYGLFSLLGVVAGYVAVLDFGFSWATTRFIADSIERRDDERTRGIIAASMSFHLFVGLTGGIVMAALSYPVVQWLFNVPSELRFAGTVGGLLFAAAFPFSMFHAFNTALLRGARRFGYATNLQVLNVSGTVSLMVAALVAGGDLIAVFSVVSAWQIAVSVIGTVFAWRVYGDSYRLRAPDRRLLVSLARFSFATGISSIASSLLYLPNRLAVGILLPLHAAGLFSVPLAVSQRILLIPNTLVTAALPSLTAATALEDHRTFWVTARRTLTWTLILLVPLVIVGIAWAPEILREWLGISSSDAAIVLRLSLAGVLLHSITSVGGVLCDSLGAPGIPAAASVAAGLANVALAFVLTTTSGIAGAALALPASIAILGIVMVVLWRQAHLLRPVAPAPSLTTVSFGGSVVAALAAFTLGLLWIRERLDSLAALAGYGLLFLGGAYGLSIAALYGIALRRRARDASRGSYA